MNHDIENECRCEPSDYVPPAGYNGDGSVAALARAGTGSALVVTEAQRIESARAAAHHAADAAVKAWHEYAALLDVGPDRIRAFYVHENLRLARRV